MDFDEKFEKVFGNYYTRNILFFICSSLLGSCRPKYEFKCKSYKLLKKVDPLFIDTPFEAANQYESINESLVKLQIEASRIYKNRKLDSIKNS